MFVNYALKNFWNSITHLLYQTLVSSSVWSPSFSPVYVYYEYEYDYDSHTQYDGQYNHNHALAVSFIRTALGIVLRILVDSMYISTT